MLDDDDVRDFVLLSNPRTLFGWAILLALLVALVLVVSANEDECAKRSCPTGQTPRLMKHECVCITVAKEPR